MVLKLHDFDVRSETFKGTTQEGLYAPPSTSIKVSRWSETTVLKGLKRFLTKGQSQSSKAPRSQPDLKSWEVEATVGTSGDLRRSPFSSGGRRTGGAESPFVSPQQKAPNVPPKLPKIPGDESHYSENSFMKHKNHRERDENREKVGTPKKNVQKRRCRTVALYSGRVILDQKRREKIERKIYSRELLSKNAGLEEERQRRRKKIECEIDSRESKGLLSEDAGVERFKEKKEEIERGDGSYASKKLLSNGCTRMGMDQSEPELSMSSSVQSDLPN
ncbi:hypothetical protein BDD12DRAFT_892257 [Trichophaea hybrida]|nr:hypothetical protein BDD12DRAFT_892257 [Trichophaea hybrida]